MSRLLVLILAAMLASAALVAGAQAATPAPEQPPAGAVLIVVAVSDGAAYLPFWAGDRPAHRVPTVTAPMRRAGR